MRNASELGTALIRARQLNYAGTYTGTWVLFLRRLPIGEGHNCPQPVPGFWAFWLKGSAGLQIPWAGSLWVALGSLGQISELGQTLTSLPGPVPLLCWSHECAARRAGMGVPRRATQ